MKTMKKSARSAGFAAFAAAMAVMCFAAQPAVAETEAAQTGAVSPQDFAAWLDGYKEAWETRDAAKAGALFTADATYRENPFEDAMEGRAAIEEYWSGVTADQRDVTFTYDVLTCDGDNCLAQWHAAFTSASGGAAIELDGVFLCAFADAKTVSSLKEWWHIQVTPPDESE
ncbi:nuclear transport factor 2 family protein [Hyphococcus luteus]|uniref:SnoaL-like domain-containing protein n=1 Tax=Hyphococcus luteus TaxID=2058213 RepID=A0A2S7KAD9_9PROT|nr:nuclear transport factor 2 family protein [Marinicaulis flavus]PQA89480.1 hypothetical protein CW354_00985 [Marinicaulis flavus]